MIGLKELMGLDRRAVGKLARHGITNEAALWKHLFSDLQGTQKASLFTARLKEVAAWASLDKHTLRSILWDRLSLHPRGLLGELKWQTGREDKELLDLLIADTLAYTQRQTLVAVLGKYKLEIGLAATWVLTVVALWHGLAPSEMTAFVPKKPLPAYHFLTEGDLEPRQVRKNPNLLESADETVGRWTLRPLVPDKPLRPTDLSPRSLTEEVTSGRRVLTLAVDLGPLEPVTGTTIALLFAPSKTAAVTEPDRSLLIEDIILLAIDRTDGKTDVVVALTQEDLELAAPWLGWADVLVIQNPRDDPPAGQPGS